MAGCDQEKRGTGRGGGDEGGGGVGVMMPRRMRLIEWVDSSGGTRVKGAVCFSKSQGILSIHVYNCSDRARD